MDTDFNTETVQQWLKLYTELLADLGTGAFLLNLICGH